MFEKQIEKVYQGILRSIDASDQVIYLEALSENPILDEPYLNYLIAEVSWWIYEERMQRENTVNFDTESHEVHALFDTLDKLYLKKAIFDHDGLKLLINSAVKARINFLIRPRTTLKWFVFRGEPTKPFNEISKRLDYFTDYEYLKRGFLQWINDKNVIKDEKDILSVIEFDRIIEQVDNEKIFDLSPDEFVELLEPLFSFFNPGYEKNPKNSVPTESLMIFLDDKGIYPILNKLEELYFESGVKSFTRKTILDFLYKVLDELDNNISITDIIENDRGKIEPAEIEIHSDQNIKHISELEVNNSTNLENLIIPESGEAEIKKINENPIDSYNDLTNQQFEIEESKKQEFILNLFQSDENLFEILINDLKSCINWDEANKKIELFFNNINDYDNSKLEEFKNLLQNSFFSQVT